MIAIKNRLSQFLNKDSFHNSLTSAFKTTNFFSVVILISSIISLCLIIAGYALFESVWKDVSSDMIANQFISLINQANVAVVFSFIFLSFYYLFFLFICFVLCYVILMIYRSNYRHFLKNAIMNLIINGICHLICAIMVIILLWCTTSNKIANNLNLLVFIFLLLNIIVMVRLIYLCVLNKIKLETYCYDLSYEHKFDYSHFHFTVDRQRWLNEPHQLIAKKVKKFDVIFIVLLLIFFTSIVICVSQIVNTYNYMYKNVFSVMNDRMSAVLGFNPFPRLVELKNIFKLIFLGSAQLQLPISPPPFMIPVITNNLPIEITGNIATITAPSNIDAYRLCIQIFLPFGFISLILFIFLNIIINIICQSSTQKRIYLFYNWVAMIETVLMITTFFAIVGCICTNNKQFIASNYKVLMTWFLFWWSLILIKVSYSWCINDYLIRDIKKRYNSFNSLLIHYI